MKRTACILLLFVQIQIGISQSLVPNGSFEDIVSCPIGDAQLPLAIPWNVPANTYFASPDLFNACDPFDFGVPLNGCGYQNAHSGVGYAGIFVFGESVREYLQVQLTSPLVGGVTYMTEMYVSTSQYAGFAIDAIGLYFSVGAVSGNGTYNPLPYGPQISNPANQVIEDTLNWTQISGLYTAIGGEDHITIGNFLSDSLTSYIQFRFPGWGQAYYYFDDISVSAIMETAPSMNVDAISVGPNPLAHDLYISSDLSGPLEFELYDMSGNQILWKQFEHGIKLNIESFPAGLYFYAIKSDGALQKTGKLQKY